MAQTNIFRPLKTDKSNFFLFSQFGDDLSKEYTAKDHYRIIPSRYVCVDLDIDKFVKTNASNDINSANNKLVEILQNYYENFMTVSRALSGTENNPKCLESGVVANKRLWHTLSKFNLISNPSFDNEHDLSTIPEVKYVGDINIYASDKNDDGITYNEIYCVIPPEARRTKYGFVDSNVFVPNTGDTIIIDEKYQNYIKNTDATYIWGWDDNKAFDYELSYEAIYDGKTSERFIYNGYGIEMTDDKVVTDDDSFKFNCIVVLYDIVNPALEKEQAEILLKNVPMGIYFTGSITNDMETYKYKLQNEIVQYNTNENIYGNGTSYTLRIATRYLTTQNATEFQGTTTDYKSLYPEYSAAMQSISDAITEIEHYTDSNNNIYDSLVKHLSMFKNNTVNVPYILKVKDGSYHWFVNGKDTGVAAQHSTDLGNILVSYNNDTCLYVRTPNMSTKIRKGDSNENELYIINYVDSDDTLYVRNMTVKGSFKIFDGVKTSDINDYIKDIVSNNTNPVSLGDKRTISTTDDEYISSVELSLDDNNNINISGNKTKLPDIYSFTSIGSGNAITDVSISTVSKTVSFKKGNIEGTSYTFTENGSGNAIVSVTTSGNTITFNKGDVGSATGYTKVSNSTVSASVAANANINTLNYIEKITLNTDISDSNKLKVSITTKSINIPKETSVSSVPSGAGTTYLTSISSSVNALNGSTCYRTSASISTAGAITASSFNNSADDRLKSYIEDISSDDVVDKLLKIPVRTFTFNNDPDNVHIGTSAQEVEKLFPELVTTGEDGMKSVDYGAIGLLCVKALQDIYKKLDNSNI